MALKHEIITKYSKTIFYSYSIALVLLAVLPINSATKLNDITIISFRGDYFVHALVFLPWALFNVKFGKNNWMWLLTGLIFSTGIEFLQYYLPYRVFNINDVLSNSIGIATGHLILYLFHFFSPLFKGTCRQAGREVTASCDRGVKNQKPVTINIPAEQPASSFTTEISFHS